MILIYGNHILGMSLSQPCKTILYFFRRHKFPYEHNKVKPRFDTISVYLKTNISIREQTHIIEYSGVKKIESASITRYLLAIYNKDEILIPQKDLVATQKVYAMLNLNASVL